MNQSQRAGANATNQHWPVALDEKLWFVAADEGKPVGPVSADQIARGILAGRVPRDAMVACQGDAEWRDVLDVREIVAALKAL